MNAPARQVSSAAFEVTLRPSRAVYLVDAAPEAARIGVRRAIQEASTRWGGACEPIILIGDDGAVGDRHRSIVERSRADGAVNVNLPAATAETAAAALGLDLVLLRAIDAYGPVIGTSHPGAIGDYRTVDGTNGFLIGSREGKLWEAAAAGDLTDEQYELALRPGALSVRRPYGGNYDAAQYQLGPYVQTLIERTLCHYGENRVEINMAMRPMVVWVTRGDDVADIVEFWNMRALRPIRFGSMPMVLLPEEDVEYWVGFDRYLLSALRRPNQFEPDVVLVSRSVPDIDLAAFAARFGLTATETEPHARSTPTGQPTTHSEPFTFTMAEDLLPWVSFSRSYGSTVSVIAASYDGRSTLEFDSPVPFTAEGRTLMTVGGPALAALPRRPAVATLVMKDGVWRDNGLQFTTLAQSAYRVEITVPSLAEATGTLLDEATTKWALSIKGAVGVDLLDDADISALLEPNVFEMVTALTTPRDKHMAGELADALGKDVSDLSKAERSLAERWSGRAERQFRSATTVPADGVKGPDRLEALDRIAEIGWAERGLQTDCGVCRLNSFLPLSERLASGPVRCPGCGSPSAYIKGKTSIEIAYRLDSRIDRAADQGILAHLLTIAALRRRYTDVYVLPGVDVWLPGESGNRELDLYGICDGEVTAGEVKQSAADFDEEQVRGDVSKSARVGADLHIMATPGWIAQDAIDLARQLCEHEGLNLLVLQSTDLRL